MPHVFGAGVERRASQTFHLAPAVAYKTQYLPPEWRASKRFFNSLLGRVFWALLHGSGATP